MTYRIVTTTLALLLAALAIMLAAPKNVDEETRSVQKPAPTQNSVQKSEDDSLKGFKLN